MAKVYEILTVFKPLLVNMTRQGISQDDVMYLDMFREYVRMSQEGHKKVYIVQYLSDKHKIGKATIYRVISRFSEEVAL